MALPKVSDLPGLVAALTDRLDDAEQANTALTARVEALEATVATNTAELRRLTVRADRAGYQLRTGRRS